MNIDKFNDSIKACRFCFMCRHLSGVGNVTFREADTPRIRAAMLYGVTLDKSKLAVKQSLEKLETAIRQTEEKKRFLEEIFSFHL